MRSEEFVKTWLDKKYAGAKEVGEWTTAEVVKVLNDFQKKILDEVWDRSFETETMDTNLVENFILRDDLEKILEVE